MEKQAISRYFLIFLIIAIVGACFVVFKPFLDELLIATILVVLFYAPYKQLLKIFRGRKNLASFVMCVLIILIIILPLANFATYTAERSVEAYSNALDFVKAGGLSSVADKISQSPITNFLASFGIDNDAVHSFLIEKAKFAKTWVISESGILTLASGAKGLIAGTANFLISIVIIIFSMFFFFADGKKMVEKLMYWTPLPNKYDRAIFKKFKDVSSSVMLSTFVTAIMQGLIGAVGFFIVGFPVFFTSIALALASIIPYVGTTLIWAPVGLYLLLIGKIWQGIFLLIWGAAVISSSDNIIKAYLIKDKAEVHPLFIVFSIIGGLSLFGFWGIIFGPLIISLAVTILHIYEMEYESVLER